MRTAASIPKAVWRDFSVQGNPDSPRWSGTDNLLNKNIFPYYASAEFYVGEDYQNFALAYVNNQPSRGAAYLSDVRIVKNNMMVGANLISNDIFLAGGATLFFNSWSQSTDARGAAYGMATGIVTGKDRKSVV